ncbi:MAG TPA: hypothetical protein VGO56_09955 [Pyrinomonadaceae bacterium]|nr:hypothetical protein [Pyrinomonadaceae bacterium]
MRNQGGYDPSTLTELRIEPDGNYLMTNMPDWWWFDEGTSRKTFRSENGKWEISPGLNESTWVLRLTSHDQGRDAELFGQQLPYSLRFNYGHIDDGNYMTFIKKAQ